MQERKLGILLQIGKYAYISLLVRLAKFEHLVRWAPGLVFSIPQPKLSFPKKIIQISDSQPRVREWIVSC